VNSERWRVVAGVAVLVVLVLVGIALVPPYVENLQFQRYLNDAVQHPQSPEILQASIVNKAAQLGLPVHVGDVHVVRNGNGVRVEIVYVVRVDMPLYTVDLHFHPAAAT
jgi:hypothetical protein